MIIVEEDSGGHIYTPASPRLRRLLISIRVYLVHLISSLGSSSTLLDIFQFNLVQALLSRDVDIRERDQDLALWAGSVSIPILLWRKQSAKTIPRIGGFYAFILGRNKNVSLSVVARSNYQQVKDEGLHIESATHGSHKVNIDNVYQSPDEVTSPFDYIVCTHKAVNPSKIPPLFKSAANDQTTFVVIQNGVGNEEPFRTTFPQNTIISCVTWVGATQTSPGVIAHTQSEDMQMGLFPNPDITRDPEQTRLNTFAALLKTGGTKFQIEKDIQIKRWEKVTWNAAWNSITTLADVNTQDWLASSAQAMDITKRLMCEVIDVANRCNVPLEYKLADSLVDKILGMPGIYSSMHTDMKAGRPLEVDVILGYPMQKAVEFGMDVPVLSTIYALTTAVNGRLSKL
jgi:2-dehydropantoate 2-reductase